MARFVHASQLGSQPDTYFFSLAQTADVVAVIGSDDTLRLFDASTLHPRQEFTACNKGVGCLEAGNDRSLYTAGRDGAIRGWDSRLKASTLQITEPKSAGFSAIVCRDHYIAAGTESTKEGLGDVSVHIFDTRQPAAALRTYCDSHTDTIANVSWHPSIQNLLLAGSTDGLVSIFDIEQADEEDAIQQVLNPRSAVHCSGFLGDDQAYVLSTDEQFTIFGLNKTGTPDEEPLPVAEFGDVRPQLDCMYVIDLLQNHFVSSPVLAYGHNANQRLGLSQLNRPDCCFAHPIELPGAHGDDVVRDVKFASETVVLSCGEDGHVRVWDISDASGASATSMDIGEAHNSTTKRTKREKKHAERFAPY